jgi:hypothetical protein
MQHPTVQDQVIWGPLPPPSVSVKVTPTSVTEDGPQKLTFEFTASPAPTAAITVNYRIGGSAKAGSDFTGLPPGATTGTITIPAGSTSPVTLTIDPTADTEIEPNETVILTLQQGVGYALGTSVATGTITNDDLPAVTLAVSPESVTEDGTTNLVYTFTRTGPTTSALTVKYGITGTADAADYTGATPGTGKTISFAAGYDKATLTIDPTVDTTPEFDETVILTLASGSGYTVGTKTPVAGTIENDDYLVDLILDGLPEESAPPPNELSPGAILPIGGGRTRLDLIVDSPGYAGTVTLFVNADADAVTLWDSEEDGTQVLPTTWQVGQHPRTLWVETTGVEGDVQFIAMFQNKGTTKQDAVNAVAVASRPDITFDPNDITARVNSWMNGPKNRLEDGGPDALNLSVTNAIVVDQAMGTFRSVRVKAQAIDDPAINRQDPEDYFFQGKQTMSLWGIFRGADHNPGRPYAWLRDYHPEVGVRTPADFEDLPDDQERYWEAEFQKWYDPRITAQRMEGTLDVTYIYAGKLDPGMTWIPGRDKFMPPGLPTPRGSAYPYDRPLNADYSNWVEQQPHHANQPAGWGLTSTLTLHLEFRIDLENNVSTVVGTWAIDDIDGQDNGRFNVAVQIVAP